MLRSLTTLPHGCHCYRRNLLQPGNDPDSKQRHGLRPSAPYPSQIFVGSNRRPGLARCQHHITVDLKGIQHSDPNAPSLLLVAPNGTPFILFADAFTSASPGPFEHHSGGRHTQIPNSGSSAPGRFHRPIIIPAPPGPRLFLPRATDRFPFPTPLGVRSLRVPAPSDAF